MEKTFEKNDNAGRFAERFLPSLRAPAFWEIVPLTILNFHAEIILSPAMPSAA